MKKIFTLILVTLTLVMFSGCSYLKKAEARKEAAKFNDIRVTFVTTQGEVNFFLYPEAAPITVANFINLGKRGYYDNNKIHRAVDGFIVQAGDPTETGKGGPGYTIPDEVVDWLDFYQGGMLAMANAGPGTGGSQYFFTLFPADWLNGKHTVFGEMVSDADMNVVKKLEVGDIIKEVKFTGNTDFFLSLHKDQIEKWNKVLDEKFPNLKKYPIKDPDSFGDQVQKYRNELEKLYTPQEKTKKEEKEYFIPRKIREIEQRMKAKKAAEELATSNAIDNALETEEVSDIVIKDAVVEEQVAPQEDIVVEKEVVTEKVDEVVVPVEESVDSPDKIQVETISDEELKGIDSLDDLNKTKKTFWDKMKFWKKDTAKEKVIG